MSTAAAPRPIVLVHGSRHGGWCWDRLVPHLAPHPVRWPTLSGLGEREHLLRRMSVDLTVHVDDVVGVLEHDDLRDVVLVGHSYGGMVVTGAAARVPDRIGDLVFLDALVPRSGEAHLDLADPELADRLRALAREQGGGTVVPALSTGLAYFGLDDPADQEWVAPRLSDQPLATFEEPLGDVSAAWSLRRTFLRCTRSTLVPRRVLDRVAAEPEIRTVELDAGHDVMLTEPQRLAATLLEIAAPTV